MECGGTIYGKKCGRILRIHQQLPCTRLHVTGYWHDISRIAKISESRPTLHFRSPLTNPPRLRLHPHTTWRQLHFSTWSRPCPQLKDGALQSLRRPPSMASPTRLTRRPTNSDAWRIGLRAKVAMREAGKTMATGITEVK